MTRFYRLLATNVRTNLLFYRRSRLLLLAGCLFLGITGIMLLPGMLFSGTNNRFETMMQLVNAFMSFMTMMIGLMGLISIWSHRSNRSIKLVFTRPCTPEVWVASHYVSAALFVAGSAFVIFLFFAFLSAVWAIPFQVAIFAVLPYFFLEGMLIFSALSLLSTIMHPVLALFVFLFSQAGTFRWLALTAKAGATHAAAPTAHLLEALHLLCYAAYYLLPTYSPFEEQLEHLTSSLRWEPIYIFPLLGAAGYTFLFIIFCYALTCLALRRSHLQ